jgi:hypothetical protein
VKDNTMKCLERSRYLYYRDIYVCVNLCEGVVDRTTLIERSEAVR